MTGVIFCVAGVAFLCDKHGLLVPGVVAAGVVFLYGWRDILAWQALYSRVASVVICSCGMRGALVWKAWCSRVAGAILSCNTLVWQSWYYCMAGVVFSCGSRSCGRRGLLVWQASILVWQAL